MRILKSITSIFAGLLTAIIVPAQQLPPLSVDPSIEIGSLGCGASYYIVKSPARKGYASIALVQKGDSLTAEKRKGLPSAFLSRMTVAPSRNGFIEDREGSSVYHFNDVPFYKKEVMDSMLLFTFAKMMESSAPQAIIVSGDVEPTVELRKKMNIFSMMVQKLDKAKPAPAYKWKPSPLPRVEIYQTDPSCIKVSYSGERIPDVFMNTAQALVTDIFGYEFMVLLHHRLEKDLSAAGITYSDISFSALRSCDYTGDERYTVSVTLAPGFEAQALKVIAATIGSMDAQGVSVQEFSDAKDVMLPSFMKSSHAGGDNIDRCISNFLFGANLAPESEKLTLFARKNISDENQTRFFNRYASALLAGEQNLLLEVGGRDTLDAGESLMYYNLAYRNGFAVPSERDYTWHKQDTSGFEFTAPRVRLQREKAEPASGGTVWTFSNGIKVVYKNVPGSGMFSYAWVLNGGLANVPGIKEGEGGHIGEMLSLYDVAGFPAPVFRDIIKANGLSFNADVWLSNLIISGEAPSGKFPFMVKTMLAFATERVINEEEFERYKAAQALRGPSVADVVYKELHPDYRYSSIPGALTSATQKKADSYFADRFSRFNDGVLIISGDIDAAVVKRTLTKYLGGFAIQKGVLPRSAVEFKPRAGAITLRGDAGAEGIYVAMEGPLSVTSDNYYTSFVVADALRAALLKELTPYGFIPSVSVGPMTKPQERFCIRISCTPVPAASMPADAAVPDAERAITAVRTAIANAASQAPSATDVSAWKAALLDSVNKMLASAPGFTYVQQARYALNKDMNSRYQESINAITPEKVRSFIASISSGGTVEYISK